MNISTVPTPTPTAPTTSTQNNVYICRNALDGNKTGWDTSPNFANLVAEAKRRGLSVLDCRNILNNAPNTTPTTQHRQQKGCLSLYFERQYDGLGTFPELCQFGCRSQTPRIYGGHLQKSATLIIAPDNKFIRHLHKAVIHEGIVLVRSPNVPSIKRQFDGL